MRDVMNCESMGNERLSDDVCKDGTREKIMPLKWSV
jgi:hypothetical protein